MPNAGGGQSCKACSWSSSTGDEPCALCPHQLLRATVPPDAKKPATVFIAGFSQEWRRGRDSNPRNRFKPVYTLSRRAPSAGSDTSPQHKASHTTDQNAEKQASPDRSTCQECSSTLWKMIALACGPCAPLTGAAAWRNFMDFSLNGTIGAHYGPRK